MELISKESAIDAIKESMYLIDAMEKIIRMPSIELKRGKWIKFSEHGTCPYCGNCVDLVGGKENNFCSECGADLRQREG